MAISAKHINARLKDFPGWSREGHSLTRQFVFKSFPDAIAFVTRLAFDAEAADHHPDLLINYRHVTVTWSTHSAGGVTEKDFAGVDQANRVAGIHNAA
jgi:4a-hydroxytetrahydrobiopterin dehydratase